MGVDNPEILQQVNDRSEMRMQETNMMGRGRRGGELIAGPVKTTKPPC